MSLLAKNKAKNYTINLVFKLDKSNRGSLANYVRKRESDGEK
ncbi:unnamed protein product [marine sediment metagenome]|uniref:Uncharacterized protein n=1 Tax=marine sediment metagenome TaxID=412755 RepID=X1C2U7_9ZZZZ